ncbi:MAG TPA: putative metal-binding motif-containing protein, partial [Polyangiaceae bacterium]
MMSPRTVSTALVALAFAACSSQPGSGGFGDPGASSSSGGSSSGGAGGSSSGNGGSGSSSGSVGSFGDGGTAPQPTSGCQYNDGTDHDGDGFSGQDGDCNDCDPNSNPGAFDVPKDGIDEDCNGVVDDEPSGCDKTATLASTDGFNAALAMDLCRKTTETATGKQRTWGVVGATFIAPDGSDNCSGVGGCSGNANYQLGHGNLSKLGVNAP